MRTRNFRLYFIGQLLSMIGTSAQMVALPWLVLKLTGSGTRVGLVTAIQFLPVLVGGPLAGSIVDRRDNRRLVIVVQVFLATQAGLLATLVLTDVVRLWMVYSLAFVQGIGTAFDTPSRQSLIGEMVPSEELTNALSLNVGIQNLSRVIGPLTAGLLIESIGIGLCFAFNALSFVAIVLIMLLLDRRQLTPRKKSAGKGQAMEGLRYTGATPELRNLLLLYTIVVVFTANQATVLPLLARFVFHGNARTYTYMAAMSGLGAVISAFAVAARNRPTKSLILFGVSLLAVGSIAAATAPNLGIELIAMFVIGVAGTASGITANTALQLGCRPEYRGRVMSLYFMVALGSNVVGAPLAGWTSQTFGPRWAVAIGSVASGVVALILTVMWRGRYDEPGARPEPMPAPLAAASA